jgi:hypothetical protein
LETAAYSWEATGGNPDGYIRYGNNVTGTSTCHIHAPAKFLGHWLSSDGIGSIHYDEVIFQTGGYIGSPGSYKVEIEGPGGVATYTGAQVNPSGWVSVFAPLNEIDWTVSSGTWTEILSDVTRLTIQVCHYTNTSPFEITGIDNVVLKLKEQP